MRVARHGEELPWDFLGLCLSAVLLAGLHRGPSGRPPRGLALFLRALRGEDVVTLVRHGDRFHLACVPSLFAPVMARRADGPRPANPVWEIPDVADRAADLEERAEDFLRLRSQRDEALVTVVCGLVLARPVEPDGAGAVDVAGTHRTDFPRSRPGGELYADHRRQVPVQVGQ